MRHKGSRAPELLDQDFPWQCALAIPIAGLGDTAAHLALRARWFGGVPLPSQGKGCRSIRFGFGTEAARVAFIGGYQDWLPKP